MAAKPAQKTAKPANPANVVAQARAGKTKPKVPFKRWAWENVKSLAGAVLIYLVVKTLFIEAFRIPSGSMIPTLLIGDWLFVNKLVYGPTVPFTNKHLPGYSQPKRHDVVVFVSPYQPDEVAAGRDGTPTLVKRLIGVAGDTLYMRDGVLYRDGVAQPQGESAASNYKGDGTATSDLFEWQRRIELKNTRFGPAPAQPTLDNWGPLLIPSDHYFMMGDSRYCSKDSRYWGIVPKANVRGRPLFVYYSYRPGRKDSDGPCDGETSDRPLPFISDIRWGRIGDRIR